MHARISAFAPAVLMVIAISASACDDNGSGTRIQGRLVAPSPFQVRLVSTEPTAVIPEFFASSRCGALPPFRTRFDLLVHAERNLFIRRLGFALRDRSGRRILPTAFLTSTSASTIPGSMPVPIPTSPAIPVPGTLPVFGTPISPPFGRIGLRLDFECGVPALGTLVIDIEAADGDGAVSISQVSVPVAAQGS